MIDWSQKELLILAFDHRASFLEKMFDIKNRQPTSEEKKQIEDYKKIQQPVGLLGKQPTAKLTETQLSQQPVSQFVQ